MWRPSFDAFVKDGKTVWSGVNNPVAQKHLHAVKRGDCVFANQDRRGPPSSRSVNI